MTRPFVHALPLFNQLERVQIENVTFGLYIHLYLKELLQRFSQTYFRLRIFIRCFIYSDNSTIYVHIYIYISTYVHKSQDSFHCQFLNQFPLHHGTSFPVLSPPRARNETSEMRLKLIDFGWFNQIGSRSFDLAVGSA